MSADPNKVSLKPWLLTLVVLSIAATYYLLHITYIPTNSDDAWTTSFAYSYFYHGELQDRVFGRPAGTLIAFGYSYAALQKIVLDVFGWSRSNAILLSTCLFFLSLPFWWQISRNFGCSKNASLLYVLLLPLWEPLFRIANTARPDACCLLLTAIAFFWAQRRKYVLAGLSAGIALEVHQMGALAFVLVGVHFLFDFFQRSKSKKKLLALVAFWGTGVVLGASYYLFLHFAYMGETFSSIDRMHDWGGNFIVSYFFMTKTFRHIPVLILIVASVMLAFRKGVVREYAEVFTVTLSVILFSLVFPRPNIYYSAYFFVFAVLIVAMVACRYRCETIFVLLFLCFTLPQYGYFYYRHRNFNMADFTASMQREVPDSCRTLVGPFNAWFAFKDRRFIGSLSDMIPEAAALVRKGPVCYLRRLDAEDSRDAIDDHFDFGRAQKIFDAGGYRFGLYSLSEKGH